jgi:hypothetical protein
MLSGDQPQAVQSLAARAGIASWRAAQSPQDKLAHVAALQRAGRRVAMVGDGMNDGPVLARADLSVAMGQGVPVAQARADFIVQGGQLQALPQLLQQARRTRAVVRQNLAWAAAYNAVCVPLALAGQMPPWLAGLGMAGSSLFVVLNAARLARIAGAAAPTQPTGSLSPRCRSHGHSLHPHSALRGARARHPRRAGLGRLAWPIRLGRGGGRAHSAHRLTFIKRSPGTLGETLRHPKEGVP